MMVVMMMVVVMPVPPDYDVVVVMMMVADLNGDLGNFGCRPLGLPSLLRLQQRHRIRNRIEQIPVACRRSELWRLRRRRLGGSHCGQCGSSAQ
jgi:hypothetical protein